VCGNDASNDAALTPVSSAFARANGASANGVAVACSDSAASRSVPRAAISSAATVPPIEPVAFAPASDSSPTIVASPVTRSGSTVTTLTLP
jgi:hypothetical protein